MASAESTILGEIWNAAKEDPEGEAIRCGKRAVTYQQLTQSADALASRINETLAPDDQYVCIYAERSVEMIVAQMAVLRSGRAYIPLDRQSPRERVGFVINDSHAGLMIASRGSWQDVKDFEIPVIRLEAETCMGTPRGPSEHEPSVSNTAYAMYTSGSTGTPKAVLVSHENLAYSTRSRFDFYPENPESFLLLSSYSFDSSVVGIYWTLATGGKLVIPEEGEEQNPHAITQLIRLHGITHTLCLPSFYAKIIETAGSELIESLRIVIVAGEACSTSVAVLHKNRLPHTSLYNEYGPTEATVWSTAYKASGDETGANLPIGSTIPGTEIYVLNEKTEPVNSGETGEIYISGPGVAKGYLNQPELTDSHFVVDPFNEDADRRVYRTGDLGRFDDTRTLEFLGRVDEQLKVRGFRMEPGEIEGCLVALPEVKEAAVGANDDTLVCFVMPNSDEEISPKKLRAYLEEKLPAYMVPSSFTVVDEFPHLPNGKLDRKSLPMQFIKSDSVQFQAPRNAMEFNLKGLFENILGVRPIGIHDDFFDLGGHSLRAIELVNGMQCLFGEALPLPLVFDKPTVASLVEHLESEKTEFPRSRAVKKFRDYGTRTPLFCVPGVGGHTLRNIILPNYLDQNRPFYVFQAPGFEGDEYIETIEGLAAYYIEAMREVQARGPYLIIGECFGGIVAFEMAKQLGSEVGAVALIDCYVSNGGLTPLFRFMEKHYILYPSLFRKLGLVQSVIEDDSSETPTPTSSERSKKRVLDGREGILSAEKQSVKSEMPFYDRVRMANRKAGAAYHFTSYPGSIHMFLTRKDIPQWLDRRYIWRRFCDQKTNITCIPGNTNSMLREPDVRVLAEKLNEFLNDIDAQAEGESNAT